MALLFADGFDHYTTADISKKGWGVNGSVEINTTIVRVGRGSLKAHTTQSVTIPIASPIGNIVVGVALYPLGFPASTGDVIVLLDGTTKQLEVRITSSGQLIVTRNGTQINVADVSSTLPTNAWSFIELKATISDAAGAYEVRINGVSAFSRSGVDTKNTANATASGVRLTWTGASGAAAHFDDVYIADTTGTVANDFLGDSKSNLCTTDADGDDNAWTPSTGTDRWAMVDDETQDGDSSYNYADTAGQKQSYSYTDAPGLLVHGVQVCTTIRKDDAGAGTFRHFCKIGSNYYYSGEIGLGQTYVTYTYIWTLNPATSARWTAAEINAAQFGVERYS